MDLQNRGRRVEKQQIVDRLLKTFADGKILANDLTGGGDHWSVAIESSAFKGLSLVEQHQLVYKALGEWMQGPIHALSLNTKAL